MKKLMFSKLFIVACLLVPILPQDWAWFWLIISK